MSGEWEPLAPACAPCREPKGTCFPGPCKIYQARIAAQAATKAVAIAADPRVEAVARWLSQNIVSGTQDRDPDSEPWGASGRKAWEGWRRTAESVLAIADGVSK